MLANQRISIKTFKKFEYYPVLYFTGNKADREGQNQKKKKTTIHLNVGGQIFRMKEGLFKGGLLK
jgi:hypothetical protein